MIYLDWFPVAVDYLLLLAQFIKGNSEIIVCCRVFMFCFDSFFVALYCQFLQILDFEVHFLGRSILAPFGVNFLYFSETVPASSF